MPIRQELFDPASAFIQGRAARQDYEYGQNRNALADMELANAPAEMQRRNRLADLQVQGAQQQIDAKTAEQGYARLSQALNSGNPKQYVLQHEPEFVQAAASKGFDIANVDDQTAAQIISGFAQQYAGAAGIAPAGQIKSQEVGGTNVLTQDGKYLTAVSPKQSDGGFTLSAGQQRYGADGKLVASAPEAPASKSQFVALSPAEIAAANLPAGTSAQRDTATGKIDVLSKRDNTGVLSQKDATTAKMKLTTVALARKQLNSIKEAFETGRSGGLNAFGPGQGMLPTQAGKKFDARVDQMRSTLTALTRVPGVGAMSDYETKLDQSKFPKRDDYETVTADKLQQLDDMLALIENGYTGLLSGGQPEAQSPQKAPRQEAPPAALEFLRANPQFKGAFVQKYGYDPDAR